MDDNFRKFWGKGRALGLPALHGDFEWFGIKRPKSQDENVSCEVATRQT